VRLQHAESAGSDLVPQVLDGRAEEAALAQLESTPRGPQKAQDVVQMLDVLLVRLGIDDYVVDVHQAALPLDAEQDDVQRPLEVAGAFVSPKGMHL